MPNRYFTKSRAATLALALTTALPFATPAAAEGEVNLYSSRHYDTDERLYSDFTEATGIKVNRIEDKGGKLMARMEAEGADSPADLFITADAGNLWKAADMGLLQSVESDVLNEAIPAELRHPEGLYYGFSQRARIIFYDKAIVDPSMIQTYEDLAKPELKGKVCTRTSGNIYMLSLMSSIIEANGADGAKDWAAAVWENRARDPEGGDTDQLRGIASGQCAVAVSNHYYFARALRKDVKNLANPDDTDKLGWVFPNQEGRGTHVNISGGGVAKNAPNKENAIKFLEYLVSPEAQKYFGDGNDEFPVIAGVEPSEGVSSMGEFKADTVSVAVFGERQAEAKAVYDEVGYE
ncbi:MAG: extracellular solute-binding protein [Pseudomonadota bacterium]